MNCLFFPFSPHSPSPSLSLSLTLSYSSSRCYRFIPNVYENSHSFGVSMSSVLFFLSCKMQDLILLFFFKKKEEQKNMTGIKLYFEIDRV